MSKPNLLALPVPAYTVETRTFTDPLHPGPNEPALQAELSGLFADLAALADAAGKVSDERKADADALTERIKALAEQIEAERPHAIRLTLQRPDLSAKALVRAQARDLIATYTTAPEGLKPKLFPSLDGRPYRLHRSIWMQIGSIVALQPQEAARPASMDVYNVGEMVLIQSRMPNAFEQMAAWAAEVMEEGPERAAGNSAGATPTS